MYIWRYFKIAIRYLEIGREVILERFQTLKQTKKSNINQYLIIKSYLWPQLLKYIDLGRIWACQILG